MNLKKIKFLDLKKINEKPLRDSKIEIHKYLSSGKYILDQNVVKFEKKFSKFNNSKYCIGVGSGHDALKLALLSCGIKKNDIVIVPSITFISTWFAVSEIGAIPYPVDINYEDATINENNLPKTISKKFKALISVNLYGNLCNYNYLRKYCSKKKLYLIEDSAQSHGAHMKDKKINIFGNLACFSFYPGKNLGSLCDGGAIVTNSKNLYNKLVKLRNYGSTKKYYHKTFGVNSRLNILSSIFLNHKLDYLKKEIKIRKMQIDLYIKNINWNKNLDYLKSGKKIVSANHIFLVKTKVRNKLKNFLNKHNIETIIHYPIIPPMQAYYYKNYKKYYKNYKIAQTFSNNCLSLPLGSHLKENEIIYISKYINSFYSKM
jgi:dTDP-4-amino-4,6-dideoxygalactose transaminase